MILRLVALVLCTIRIVSQDDFSDTNHITTQTLVDNTTQKSSNNDQMNILEMILNSNLREKVKFFLYKRKHKSRRELMQFPRTAKSSNEFQDGINYYFGDFNPELETKLLIHGWHSNEESDTVQNIKNNYLSRKNLNIVTVDYRDIAANDFYYYPAFQIREVGKYIAELIDYLVTMKNASAEDFHLIGHSLGCHLAGYAGSFTKSGQVGRITGLDPAIIGFEWSGPESRLDASDAVFVDIIHTAAGSLGFRNPLGHADFYPNGGFIQPGCGTNLIDQRAAHGISVSSIARRIMEVIIFFVEIRYPCTSWAAFTRGNYNGSDMVLMGEGTSREVKGIFCLQTNPKPPYAMGPFFGPFGFFWDTINLLNG